MRKRSSAPWGWAWNSALLGLDSAKTIAARSHMMASPALHGTQELNAEMHRMSSEKVEAAWLGVVEAQKAWTHFAFQSAMGHVRTPADVAYGLGAIADAAMRPVRKKAKSNATRLTGAAKTRR